MPPCNFLLVPRYADGTVYEGYMKNGKPHGYGVLEWGRIDNHLKYTGEFENGKMHGRGKVRGHGKGTLGFEFRCSPF